VEVSRRVWLAGGLSYGSGLPFEFSGTPAQAVAQFGERIVDRVDFDEGRVKPRVSLDLSAGLGVGPSPGRVTLQFDVRNLTNRFDVINFAGLFSGTAVAPSRTAAVRIRAGF
jgi:outer membrane receptor protein involved in Fe transport